MADEGPIVITKVSGSGGAVTAATCKEQLLYEIHDPAAYITPDTVADFSRVTVTEVAHDRVAWTARPVARGRRRLKVSLGYRDGFIGEGQISYAGSGRRPPCAARGRIVARDRLARSGSLPSDIRCDLIGVDALHGEAMSAAVAEPYEVRVRVAARAPSRRGRRANRRRSRGAVHQRSRGRRRRDPIGPRGRGVASTFIPRALVPCTVQVEVA